MLDTFVDFADISSYLRLKHSAWKRGCAISFELQMTQTSLTLFWKALSLTRVLPKKIKIENLHQPA